MAKKTISAPSWNLSDFYSSISDKKINADLKNISKKTENFVKNFSQKISKLEAEKLFEAIESYEEICEEIGKPCLFK